jgi:hypothetical protein
MIRIIYNNTTGEILSQAYLEQDIVQVMSHMNNCEYILNDFELDDTTFWQYKVDLATKTLIPKT